MAGVSGAAALDCQPLRVLCLRHTRRYTSVSAKQLQHKITFLQGQHSDSKTERKVVTFTSNALHVTAVFLCS